MKLEHRLKAIENKLKLKDSAQSFANEDLSKHLLAVAERLGGTPLSEAIKSASPASIAALALDGRMNDEVAEKCAEFARREGAVGRLFTSILENAQ